jgi:NAD-dependent SIR2 family protein deacetylase
MNEDNVDDFMNYEGKEYCINCSDKLYIYECASCHKNYIDEDGFESDAYELPEICPNCLKKERYEQKQKDERRRNI